jgi:hypothetical protein
MFFDVIAGERARRIRQHPDEPQFIPDPTDPRAEKPSPVEPGHPETAPPIADPTDPRNGDAAA